MRSATIVARPKSLRRKNYAAELNFLPLYANIAMTLTSVDKSLLLATYFRGMPDNRGPWISNCDQIVTLSLYYTGDLSSDDCVARFFNRGYVGELYDDEGELTVEIAARYAELIKLLRRRPELIEGSGNFDTPAHPTFTSCRLTQAGIDLIASIANSFPPKPKFPNWPDSRQAI